MAERDSTEGRDSTRFDPRFDPAFQPGYDPANDSAIVAGGTGDEPPRTGSAPIQPAVSSQSDRPVMSALARPTVASVGMSSAEPFPSPAPASTRPGQFPTAVSAGEPPAALPPSAQPDVSDRPRSARDAEADVPPVSAGRNPFVVALWVLSALFVLGGAALLQALPMLNQRAQSGTGIDSIYLFLQAALYGAPMLIVLGFATAALTLFFHALGWRRR